jgi:hypothetical protein
MRANEQRTTETKPEMATADKDNEVDPHAGDRKRKTPRLVAPPCPNPETENMAKDGHDAAETLQQLLLLLLCRNGPPASAGIPSRRRDQVSRPAFAQDPPTLVALILRPCCRTSVPTIC